MDEKKRPWVKLSEFIETSDLQAIKDLERLCSTHDGCSLKLELDYKYNAAKKLGGVPIEWNEFLYFKGESLLGYVGIGCFNGMHGELNGMVHPEYRGKGIFTRLSQLALAECERRNLEQVLLLSDRNSALGQAFIKKMPVALHHSEYEMDLLETYEIESESQFEEPITLRKARNSDVEEVARQNAIYFGEGYDPENMVMPEEEERRGMTVYLAEYQGEVIGKTHLQLIDSVAGIFGLGVLPGYRGRGFGRRILNLSVSKLKENNPKRVMLQVEAKNETALNLYKSCGFVSQSTMDYYLYK